MRYILAFVSGRDIMRRMAMKIKKIIPVFLTAILLCLFSAVPVLAEEGFAHEYYRLMDTASLLSEEDLESLTAKLDEISIRQKMEVAIVTTDTLDNMNITEYADGLYESCEYGYGDDKDGLMLLISMEDNDWHITTHGYGITAFTDKGIAYIGELITPYMSEGDFATAFSTFADLCDDFITQARGGDPYDYHNLPELPRESFGELWLTWLPISVIFGIIAASIHVGKMKAKLKTVRSQVAANSYLKGGSLNITDSREMFLYSAVTKSRKKTSNSGGSGGSSTHTSSSGSTYGGGGGKF